MRTNRWKGFLAAGMIGSLLCAGSLRAEEVPALVLPLIMGGETIENLPRIEEELNAYLLDKLKMQIHFKPVEIGALKDYYLMHKSSKNAPDFLCLLPGESELSTMVEAGLILPLDELLKTCAPETLEAASEVLSAGKLNGIQYMIPQVKDSYSMGTSIEFNTELVKKYDLDISRIKTLADLEPFLKLIHEKEPDSIPLICNSDGTGYTQLLSGYDNLSDNLGVLNLRHTDELEVVNWFETEEFMELAMQMRDWYQKGYIARDALIIQTSSTEMVQSGEAFCTISTIMPGADEGLEGNEETGLSEVQLTDQPQLLNSYQLGLEGICISETCRYPEKAMEFINLLYTDPYVANLVENGIEGENYVFTQDGRIRQGSCRMLVFGQPMNRKLCYHPEKDGEDYEAKLQAFERQNTESPAMGFVFDAGEVAREMSLCRSVIEEYYPVIDCGCVDPQTEIPKFVKALKEAGIDRILEEKQRQLLKWREEHA